MKEISSTQYKIQNIITLIVWSVLTLSMVKLSHTLNLMNTLSFKSVLMTIPFWTVLLVVSAGLSAVIYRNRKERIIKGRVKRIVLTFVAGVVTAFCFYGKALIFTEDGLWFTSNRLGLFFVAFIVSAIYFCISELALLSGSHIFYKKTAISEDRKKIMIHTAIIFVFQLIVFGLYLYAFNPGNMSYDSYSQLSEVRKIKMMGTWHPIGHTLFIGMLLKIWDNVLIIGIFHVLMASLVFTQWFYILLKKGIKPIFLYIVFLIIILSPSTGVNVVTHWKDIPFTLSLLWGTSIVFRMLKSRDFFQSPIHLVEILVAFVMIGIFRHNGILSFIGLMIFSIYYLVKNRFYNKLDFSITTLALTLSVVVFINWIYPNMIVVDHNPPGMKLRPVFQGLGAVYVKGAEESYSEKDRKMVESIAEPEGMIEHYQPYFADVYSNNLPKLIENLSEHTTGEVLKVYVDMLIKEPTVILGDKFNLSIGMWSVTEDNFSYNNRYTTKIEDPLKTEFGILRSENSLEPMLNDYISTFQKKISDDEKWTRVFIDTFFWRCGIYTVLSIMMLIFMMNMNKKYFNLFIPMIGNYFIVFLTMPAQDFRYFWFMLLIFPMILLGSFIELRDNESYVKY